ncbi:MAG TPA: ribose 5-phosphate isomerase B [Syntrophales bacterium]|nr:ribose 5-phosphate isomerase B [Syntrophales bacterium]HOM08319.1 ribose 5-phosphate isomerase B [Syntrophales bacterium]HOO00328.1 ribose 5-phosphate isomerase B [Syntrophales bacterium]HPC01704.1 ribose 5-phosphate isomerase B [Syntrophales bacterium]HPQ06606.1 ribose 5-phosphate isomerase B [Syntrophales bacterium]
MTPQTVAIASDHAGFRLKEAVKPLVSSLGFTVSDLGPADETSVDYPDFAAPVARGVARGDYDRGILVCGSGVGMTIVANRFPGVRAALCLDEETARLSRLHNDANVLVLAGRMTSPEKAAVIVRTWFATPFEGGRHQRRLEKIKFLETGIDNPCKEVTKPHVPS